MKQFIQNILSHVKREQVKDKIKTSVSWDGDEFITRTPILYTGNDFTLNVVLLQKDLCLLFIQMIKILKSKLRTMVTNENINRFLTQDIKTHGFVN